MGIASYPRGYPGSSVRCARLDVRCDFATENLMESWALRGTTRIWGALAAVQIVGERRSVWSRLGLVKCHSPGNDDSDGPIVCAR
jgi:hypothetical protein